MSSYSMGTASKPGQLLMDSSSIASGIVPFQSGPPGVLNVTRPPSGAVASSPPAKLQEETIVSNSSTPYTNSKLTICGVVQSIDVITAKKVKLQPDDHVLELRIVQNGVGPTANNNHHSPVTMTDASKQGFPSAAAPNTQSTKAPLPLPPVTTQHLGAKKFGDSVCSLHSSVSDSSRADDLANGQLIIFRVNGQWATSCSIINPGDQVQISDFALHCIRQQKKLKPAAMLAAAQNNSRGRSSMEVDETDDADYFVWSIHVIEPNEKTKVGISRERNIQITGTNVGLLEPLDLTKAETASSYGRSPLVLNHFSGLGRFYDVLFSQRPGYDEQCAFLDRLVGQQTAILDAGCGTACMSFYLRNAGVYPVLLDASGAICQILQEKNTWFQTVDSKRPLTIVQDDLAAFNPSHCDGIPASYQFINCLKVLPLLPTLDHITKSVQNLASFLQPGGTMLVSVINEQWVQRRPRTLQRTKSLPLDSIKLGYGSAHFEASHGVAEVVTREQTLTNVKAAVAIAPQLPLAASVLSTALTGSSDTTQETATATEEKNGPKGYDLLDRNILRRATTWVGSAHFTVSATDEYGFCSDVDAETLVVPDDDEPAPEEHLRSEEQPVPRSKFVGFEDTIIELIPSTGFWYHLFQRNGLEIASTHGDATGSVYHPLESEEIVFVLKKPR